MSEWYGEALNQLQANLALGLDETNCPWLDQEGCCIESLRQVLRNHSTGRRYLEYPRLERLAAAEVYPQSFGLWADY